MCNELLLFQRPVPKGKKKCGMTKWRMQKEAFKKAGGCIPSAHREFKLSDSSTYAEILREKEIRPSSLRVAVLKYVTEHEVHPTAETVYQALIGSYPSLSRTTVYNTLHLLSTKHILNSLNIEDEQVRYDAKLTPHIHFKCTECLKIFDIVSDSVPEFYKSCSAMLPQDFQAGQTQISIWGKCPECSKKQ